MDPISTVITFAAAHPAIFVIAVGVLGVVLVVLKSGIIWKVVGIVLILAAVGWFTGISALGISPHYGFGVTA